LAVLLYSHLRRGVGFLLKSKGSTVRWLRANADHGKRKRNYLVVVVAIGRFLLAVRFADE
jgi:hypothetical protein